MDDTNIGMYEKFYVRRADGRSGAGAKHAGCRYFVLDLDHDPHAKPALLAYAASCAFAYPLLAQDLKTIIDGGPVPGSGPRAVFGADD